MWRALGLPLKDDETPWCAGFVGFAVERSGGGYVGFVTGRDTAGNLMVLVGNQADAVNMSPSQPHASPALMAERRPVARECHSDLRDLDEVQLRQGVGSGQKNPQGPAAGNAGVDQDVG